MSLIDDEAIDFFFGAALDAPKTSLRQSQSSLTASTENELIIRNPFRHVVSQHIESRRNSFRSC
jgi:hypothetical protein